MEKWQEYCMLCGTHVGTCSGLVAGYCSTCYPQSVFAEGATRIEFPEPLRVPEGQSVHAAITQAICDGRAKVLYTE